MDVKKVASDSTKNVFKNGNMPTREAYTKFWIKMINQIERGKVNQQSFLLDK